MTVQLKARKVGFLGSSPSSSSLAPFEDSAWEIWATGPGCHNDPNFKSRFDRWFELHNMADNDPQYGAVIDPGYFQWLQRIADEGKMVYFRPPLYPGMKGELFPWDEILAKHDPYFLDSTVAWMFAFVYEFCDVDEIGLWGVDFATDEERRKQRKGTKHFIELFKLKGIPCYIPDVSDMSFKTAPYPDITPLGKKLDTHMKLLTPEQNSTIKTIQDLRNALEEQEKHLSRINGTMQTLEYFKENLS